MRKEKCFIILTCVLGMATSQSSNECKTPNYENGVCIDIKRCPKLINLLENQRQVPSVLVFLKKSFCGFEGEDYKRTKVCCALENNEESTVPKAPVAPVEPAAPVAPVTMSNPTNNIGTTYNGGAKLPSQSKCGITNVTRSRIVGGTPAELGAWPWMAALGYQGSNRNNRALQWLCGGTLISSTHVLTAAHCVYNVPVKLTTVRLGELDLNPTVDDGASPVDVPVDRIIIHAKYQPQELTSDIALLKLRNSVTYNVFIQPICLPITPAMRNADMSRSLPFVAGWGTTQPNPSEPPSFPPTTTLMEVQVPMSRIAECKQAYSKQKAVIDDRVLCAGYPEGGKDSCRGDSGGPLMMPKGKQYFLMGIVSYGLTICGQPGYPGVYTRVPSFIDWIVEKTNEN
uniref:CLIP domain-containing serine protease n=1 Tax=Sitobion avenae TaxID=44664 RepID=A0A650G1Y3_9HEMI|nr:trypsine [Sitobion avenae]